MVSDMSSHPIVPSSPTLRSGVVMVNGNAAVVNPDFTAGNSYLQVLDHVLMPPVAVLKALLVIPHPSPAQRRSPPSPRSKAPPPLKSKAPPSPRSKAPPFPRSKGPPAQQIKRPPPSKKSPPLAGRR